MRACRPLLVDSFAASRRTVQALCATKNPRLFRQQLRDFIFHDPRLQRDIVRSERKQFSRNVPSRHQQERTSSPSSSSRVAAALTRSFYQQQITALMHEVEQRGSSQLAVAMATFLRDEMPKWVAVGVKFQPLWAKQLLSTIQGRVALSAIEEGADQPTNEGDVTSLLQGLVAELLQIPSGSEDPSPSASSSTALAVVQDEHQQLTTAAASSSSSSLLSPQLVSLMLRGRVDLLVTPNDSFSRYLTEQRLVSSPAELSSLLVALRLAPTKLLRVHRSSNFAEVASRALRQRPGVEPISIFSSPGGPQAGDLLSSSSLFLLHSPSALMTKEYDRDAPSSTSSSAHEVTHSVYHSNRVFVQKLLRERVCSYQSVSSMLPVLVAQIQPGDAVWDMCGAPGSKSMQVLDDWQTRTTSSSSSISSRSSTPAAPRGWLVVNDQSTKRALQASHRVGHFSPGVAVVSMDGRVVPDGFVQAFDVVLLDAPCSGEGQLGTNLNAWRLWHPRRAIGFHTRQVALLRAALLACKPGGTVLYSTCTMNPLENEAVVAAVLSEGLAELEDMSHVLSRYPELRHALQPGLRSWSVPSGSGGYHSTVRDAQQRGDEDLPRTLFPPLSHNDDGGGSGKEESFVLSSLRHCRRVLPHRTVVTPSGAPMTLEAFFVAKMRRRRSSSSTIPLLAANAATNPKMPMLSSSPRGGWVHSQQVSPLTSAAAAGGASLAHSSSSAVFEPLSLTGRTLQKLLHPFFLSSSSSSGGPRKTHVSRASELDLQTAAALARQAFSQSPWVFVHGASPHTTMPSPSMTTQEDSMYELSSSATAAAGLQSVVALHKNLLPPMQSLITSTRHHAGAASGVGSSFSPSSLLALGCVVFDANGTLTESGASFLHHHLQEDGRNSSATTVSQQVTLPLLAFQLLLSEQRLVITADPTKDDRAAMMAATTPDDARKELIRQGGARSTAAPPPEWVQRILVTDRDRLHDGNAIVSLQSNVAKPLGLRSVVCPVTLEWSPSSSAAMSSGPNHNYYHKMEKEAQKESLTVRLTLPSASRNRLLAMVQRAIRLEKGHAKGEGEGEGGDPRHHDYHRRRTHWQNQVQQKLSQTFESHELPRSPRAGIPPPPPPLSSATAVAGRGGKMLLAARSNDIPSGRSEEVFRF